MFERTSHLESLYEAGAYGISESSELITIKECRPRMLTQISGWQHSFKSVCESLESLLGIKMPVDLAMANSENNISIFRVGPERLWLVLDQENEFIERINNWSEGVTCVLTDIAHSRTIIRVAGESAKDVICRGLPVDIDVSVFPPGSIVQSYMHHIPVLIHHLCDENKTAYEIYVTNDYAISYWECLVETAQQFGCRIDNVT